MSEYRNDDDGLWLARHPLWIRVLGWVMIPLIAICGIYVMVIPVIESRYEIVFVASCLFLGGAVLYMSVLAFSVFPFLRADIEFGEDGFSVYFPSGKSCLYKWCEVSSIKHHGSVQVLVLKGVSNKTLLAITEQAHSYERFAEISARKLGSK